MPKTECDLKAIMYPAYGTYVFETPVAFQSSAIILNQISSLREISR